MCEIRVSRGEGTGDDFIDKYIKERNDMKGDDFLDKYIKDRNDMKSLLHALSSPFHCRRPPVFTRLHLIDKKERGKEGSFFALRESNFSFRQSDP